MNLLHALRLENNPSPIISIVGAGGKTTAMFQLARQLLVSGHRSKIFVTTTTHLGAWQTQFADQHIVLNHQQISTFETSIIQQGVILFTGEVIDEKTQAIDPESLKWLRAKCKNEHIPLLIEADGSKQKPIKAPAAHEPPIPNFSKIVIHVTGLSALGKNLSVQHVHRPEIFSQLTQLEINRPITTQHISTLLTHLQGALKNIPPHAKKIALLNQADTTQLQSAGGEIAHHIRHHFDSILVGSLQQDNFQTLEKTAGIILAAGDSTRFGAPKQLLDWHGKPFIRHIAETALQAGLEPVLVICGDHYVEISSALQGLPVQIIHNPNYKNGQSESIKLGIQELAPSVLSDTSPKFEGSFVEFGGGRVGACIFLLADQPQIPVAVIKALKEKHAQTLAPVIIPLVLEEKRANPVLFDKVTFADLLQLTGDTGGRAIFHKHQVEFLPWHDDLLIFDVDTPEDYERLKGIETL